MANGNSVQLLWIIELVFVGRWKMLKSWHRGCACGNLLPAGPGLDHPKQGSFPPHCFPTLMTFPGFSSDGIKGGWILCGANTNHALMHVPQAAFPHRHTPFCALCFNTLWFCFQAQMHHPGLPEQSPVSVLFLSRHSQALQTSQLELLSDRVYTCQSQPWTAGIPQKGP